MHKTKGNEMKYLLDRLAEASTWRGLVMIAMGFGVHWSPDSQAAIISTGALVAGAIGAIIPDKK
jgi:hypothetical protein